MIFYMALGKGKVPIIQVKINGCSFKALVDTGSSVTYCKAKTFQTIKTENPYLNAKHTNTSGIAANGNRYKFLGETEARLEIGQTKINAGMLISDDNNCPSDLIIGTDLLQKINEINMDIRLDF